MAWGMFPELCYSNRSPCQSPSHAWMAPGMSPQTQYSCCATRLFESQGSSGPSALRKAKFPAVAFHVKTFEFRVFVRAFASPVFDDTLVQGPSVVLHGISNLRPRWRLRGVQRQPELRPRLRLKAVRHREPPVVLLPWSPLLLDSCLPRLRSRRLGGARAGHWTWSSMLRRKRLTSCILSATSDRWQTCKHGVRSRRRAVTTSAGLCVFYSRHHQSMNE